MFLTSTKVESEQVQLPQQPSNLNFSDYTRTDLREGTSNTRRGIGVVLTSFPLELW